MTDEDTVKTNPHRVVRRNGLLSQLANIGFAIGIGLIAIIIEPFLTSDEVYIVRSAWAGVAAIASLSFSCYVQLLKESDQ